MLLRMGDGTQLQAMAERLIQLVKDVETLRGELRAVRDRLDTLERRERERRHD